MTIYVRSLEARAQLVFQKNLLLMLMKLVYLIGDSRAEDPESFIWFEKFERLVAHSGISILEVQSVAF
jgi:uncharacterized membrane protein